MKTQKVLRKNIWIRSVVIFTVIALQWLQLEYSVRPPEDWLFSQSELLIIMNLAILWIPNLLMSFLWGNWVVTLSITSIIMTSWSIVGYYVMQYHGSPLCFSVLHNAATALAVIDGYSFDITGQVIVLLVMGLAQGVLIVWLAKITPQKNTAPLRRERSISAVLLVLDTVLLWLLMFSPWALKPQNTITWSWVEAANSYGYASCLVEDMLRSATPYTKPIGYDANIIEIPAEEAARTEEYPDVILILNETFFDLEDYTELALEFNPMEAFYALDNAVYGRAATPTYGGGTNNAEYELLTSNSIYLLTADAPFNYLKLSTESNSVVKYFNELGYETFGMHCAVPTNYSRNKAYPILGFDHTVLGQENFKYLNYYGARPWLDSDNYRDLFNLYEAAGENPRFFYLLTYQNHGGWDQNDAALDTVHTGVNFGQYTGQVNEYLSSMAMSAEAFVELTEYFSQVDRPVIVCMVGDHAPSFTVDIPSDKPMTEEEKRRNMQLTPYVIWANYEVEFPNTYKFASITDLVPLVLEVAGMPLTPYYRTILDVHEIIPLRFSNGLYVDSNGNVGAFSEDDKYFAQLRQYYYMEYNSLMAGKDYLSELFRVAQ